MRLSIILSFLFICVAYSGTKGQSSKEIQFKPLKVTLKDDVSAQFDVTVGADSMQAVSVDGLKFSIKIRNKSEKTATLINPMDSFTLNLINKKGVGALYPHIPKMVIHAPPGTKIPFVTFNVLRIEVNGKQRNDNLEENITKSLNSIRQGKKYEGL